MSITTMEELKLLRIDADYLKTPNYALFHNKIPICHSVEITDISTTPLYDVTVKCTGEFVADYESQPIECVNPGETVKVIPFCINPDPTKLAAITERVATSFRLTAYSRDRIIGEAEFELEFMPYDHWTGLNVLPQTLASFVTPNHPAIGQLTAKAAGILKRLTGHSALCDPGDVRRQVAAVFAAIHEAGIVYRSLPASYEEVGQRILMPDQVATSKTANCIELTLLMASVLEAIGINPIIIIEKGHAYLGVWLVDDCYISGVGDDPAFIEKLCSPGIDVMMVVECTAMVWENTSLEKAIKAAEANLANHEMFELFIDVKRCRLEKILPMPTRIESGGEYTFESEGVEHDSCRLDVEERDRYDLTCLSNDGRQLTKFDIWERKLLDFTLRNALLNLSLRRRALQFISFGVGRVEDRLQSGEEFIILPPPHSDMELQSYPGLERSKIHRELHDLISNDIEHKRLHSYLEMPDMMPVLKNIHRVSRNTLEESGANTLFLAIGALRWYEEDKLGKPRYAPILLMPVDMEYKKGHYYIRMRDEDIALNITLLEFLRQNFNISIAGLEPLPQDEKGVDVALVFAIIRDAIKDKKLWDVEEECVLGVFSFSKFVMWNDVHNHRDDLAGNEVITSLASNRLSWTPKHKALDLQEIDGTVSPTDIALPLPVDSSQLTAVIKGGEGNSFIIYGPPGTGKSQTITNLIANALYHGKRVLFVAEKMAALSVVQKRLEKIGIGPFCLELHSNKATKRHVLKQLEKGLKAISGKSVENFNMTAEKIFEKRKELIRYVKALHTPDSQDGLSVYDCIVRAEGIDTPPLPGFHYDKKIDSFITKEGIEGIDGILSREIDAVVSVSGEPSTSRLKGFRVDESMTKNPGKVSADLNKEAIKLEEYTSQATELKKARELGIHLQTYYTDKIFEENPELLLRQWQEANAKWFVPKFFAKRSFLKRMKKYSPLLTMQKIEPLIDELISYRRMHILISEANEILHRYFGLNFLEDELADPAQTEMYRSRIAGWAESTGQMGQWLHWVELSDRLKAYGMGSAADYLEENLSHTTDIRNAFLKALYLAKAKEKIAADETLVRFAGALQDLKVDEYRLLNDKFQRLISKELHARLAGQVAAGSADDYNGEKELLRRAISSGGRGQSLRDLFDQLPTLLPKLCPCMLMSPISVAQYIDLKADPFDLVIFDEASQMPTSEAIGSIARGKALIVVGDPKQMPPTSFFSSNNVEVEEAVIDDMESILEDCRTLDMPAVQLSWHYRSRHESLIAFSNNEYYDGSLITFPSIDDKSTKVHYRHVEGGVYDKGGRRSNEVEAKAIVDEISRRLLDPELRTQSIGVIAFSVPQQSLIEDLLQDRLDGSPALQEAASAMYEPIFVKNLENVQGDERDVILFSIGYGPDKFGKVSMNFGPLNNAGGERRLNVAVSRARKEMYVFSTLKAADIDLHRSKAKGVEGLKHFLYFAETQTLPATSRRQHVHKHSAIADSIAQELRKLGYASTTDVGRSQFRVDVAVESKTEPGRYVLAILLDGEDYRDTKTTRDREVVQPSVLHDLEWRTMRVWSIDWLRDRKQVIKNILNALNDIRPGNA